MSSSRNSTEATCRQSHAHAKSDSDGAAWLSDRIDTPLVGRGFPQSFSRNSISVDVIDMPEDEQCSKPHSKSARTCMLSSASALLYAACAIGMNFTNKASLMHFPLANVLLFCQMLAVIFIVFPLRFFGVVDFPALTAAKAKSLLPVTLLYVSNVGFALLGLKTLNIPMYSTLKRLTPMMIILGKWRMQKTLPPRGILASVGIVLAGCIIAGMGDLSFDLKGYCYALASCTLQATYLLLVEGRGARKGIGSTEMLVYNAVLSIPFLIVTVAVSGEGARIIPTFQAAAVTLGAVRLVTLLVFSSIAGMLLNFSLFYCTNMNSALTTTIVGTLKGVIATFLGFFLLGGVDFHFLNVVGISLNTVGGVWYSVIKYNQRRGNAKKAREEEQLLLPVTTVVKTTTSNSMTSAVYEPMPIFSSSLNLVKPANRSMDSLKNFENFGPRTPDKQSMERLV